MEDLVGVFPMIFAQDLLLGGDGDHGSCVLQGGEIMEK